MERIAFHYGVEGEEFFVLSNGIFTTGGGNKGQFAKVQHIPVKGAELDKVVAVNQLSREIAEGKYTPAQAKEKLSQIRQMAGKKKITRMLASGVGSACFCYLFGGSVLDSVASFFAGFLLYIFVIYTAPHMSKIPLNIFGGGIVTLFCILFYNIGFGDDMSHMIIGAIIPLVPGVPFVNGIRDIADGDYISGAVRLLDAMLVFMCIAIGVGIVFTVYHRVFGGAIL
jgi:uncharacterized membrane protein YjjP (DUF1212 family)